MLNVTSKNGEVSYSTLSTAIIGKAAASIAVYPNPLVGKALNVAFNNLGAGKYTVAIYTVLGNKVFEKSITHNTGTLVKQLAIGIYLASGTYTVRVSKP
ncbi:T9SS type A sorting domain-containing protein [Parasediminibacterium sp. JCM 36343]|uniref:T9SS type A sorting domain-containing protein n=1 Tax=Parasediminibacterium sp. JCM 36343 TaxID=3374279 RepID=UPI00397C955D